MQGKEYVMDLYKGSKVINKPDKILSQVLIFSVIGMLMVMGARETYADLISPANKIDWSGNAGLNYTIPIYVVHKNAKTDYGAVGDGVADDTTAIQNCINGTDPGKACYLPAGTYKVSSEITITKGIVLRGAGPTLTKIKLYGNSPISITGSLTNTTSSMASRATNWIKDSQTISVTDATAFSVGNYIGVRQKNLSDCQNAYGSAYVKSVCTFSGKHTGDNAADTLTDSAKEWTTDQWKDNYIIENVTAGATAGFSRGTITRNTATTISATLVSDCSPAANCRTTWNAGDIYYIYPKGNNYVIPTLKPYYDYLPYTVTQIVKITGKSGNNLTISRPLYVTYHNSMLPEIIKMNLLEAAGIEDLYVEKATNSSGNNIRISKAANCWAKNVESYMTYNYHIQLQTTYGCVVRDSYIHDSWSYSGNAGYGIAMFENATDNLAENNIFYHNRHALEMEIGANGNIFGYNYSKDPMNESVPMSFLEIDACIHGGNNYMNLYEGNIVAHMASDYATGGSKFNTFFRNWVTRDHSLGFVLGGDPAPGRQIYWPTAVEIQMDTLYTNMVGNILNTAGVGKSAFATIIWGQNQSNQSVKDPRSKGTTTMCGNYDMFAGIYQTDNDACAEAIPASLYRTSKPSFFQDSAWPPIGPDVSTKVTEIPAIRRFNAPLPPRNIRIY